MMSIVPENLKEEVSIITGKKVSNLKRLREILNNEGRNSWDVSVQVLKEELREQGRGQISYTDLENAIATNNTHKIINLLQERFLDVVSETEIEIMRTYVTSKNKLKELYALANNNNRFIATVMSL